MIDDGNISPPGTSSSSISDDLDEKCAVCGDFAKYNHFGAITCSACAAFFRRIVARQKTYAQCEHQSIQNEKVCIANSVALRNAWLLECNPKQFVLKHWPERHPSVNQCLPEISATVDLFTLWNIFEAAIANLMLNSEPINAMDEGRRHYFFDGRIMSLSVDGMMQFYSSMPALLDLQDFTKQIALPFCDKINSLRVPFSQAVLDEVELAALLHVVFSMIDSVPPPNIRVSLMRQRNQILTELREHYRQTGQDFSERLGRLTELVEHLLQSLKAMKEHFTILQLYMQTARIPTQENLMLGQLYQHQ